MRPRSIRLFDIAYLGSLAIGVAGLADTHTATTSQLITFVVVIAISLAVWYLASFRASNIARWFIAVFTGVGVLMTLPTLDASVFDGSLAGASSGLALVLEIALIVLLFRPDARAYFARRTPAASAL